MSCVVPHEEGHYSCWKDAQLLPFQRRELFFPPCRCRSQRCYAARETAGNHCACCGHLFCTGYSHIIQLITQSVAFQCCGGQRAGPLPMARVKYPSEGQHSPSCLIQIFSFVPVSAVLWQEVFGGGGSLEGTCFEALGIPQ